MARRLGYGGLGNTNGARDFSGKSEAVTGPAFIQTGVLEFRKTTGGLLGYRKTTGTLGFEKK